jgi:hypothetical protein
MNFCEVDIEDYSPRYCGIDFAGIVGIGLISDDETPTEEELQSYDFWFNKLSETGYYVLRNTRGEYNGGEVIEEEDLQGTRVVGADHAMTFDSTAMIENCDFWNEVIKKQWKFVMVTSGGLMYYIDKPTSVYTKVNNAKSTKAQAYYQSDLKWHDFSNPVILEAPEGLFFGIGPDLNSLTVDSNVFTVDSDIIYADQTIY